MLEVTVDSLGNPGTFDITDKDDPLYYIARAAHEQSLNLYNLETAGFKFRQQVDTDFNALEEALDDYADSVATWFDTAVDASDAGSPVPAPPNMPDIITGVITVLTGNPLLALLAKIAVHLLVKWLEKKLDPDTQAKEIAQVLKQAFIGEADSEEFPLMDLLANVPIQIVLSQGGGVADVMKTSRLGV